MVRKPFKLQAFTGRFHETLLSGCWLMDRLLCFVVGDSVMLRMQSWT